jgi:ELWxxDGT repeat protein
MPRPLQNPIFAIGIGLSILVLGAPALGAQPAYRVKDVNAGTASTPLDNYLGGFGALGGTVFFAGQDAANGVELWKSDGTPGGTVLVKDVVSGPGNSNPGAFTRVGNTMFFSWLDNALMKTDGTEAGTVAVRNFSLVRSSINVGGTLFLSASDGINGNELWKSDGTPAGTVMVKDIFAGGSNSHGVDIDAELVAIGNTVYFIGQDGTNGRELWKSDGTAAGTVMVKDIAAGSASGLTSLLTYFTNVNGVLFFAANDFVNGVELWKSDGTAAGTVMVKNINQAGDGNTNPYQLTNVGGTLYFVATNFTLATGQELWKSDGTAAGTVIVKDITPGPLSSNVYNLVNVNGVLFFTAYSTANGNELWKSNGTDAGTVMVKDINPGGGDSIPFGQIAQFRPVGHRLYFNASEGTNGLELWRSDGTAAGTVRVHDIRPGSNASNPTFLTRAGSLLFFGADDGTTGLEPWALNVNEDRSVDFDGDRKTDLTVFNPPSGLWYIRSSATGSVTAVGYGATGYVPTPGDYDGDLKTDVAVYHPPSQSWFVLSSATGADTMTSFGRPNAAPVRGDFDKDGRTDLGVFQDATGVWAVRLSAGSDATVTFGGSGYRTVPGDYDGDGQTDLGAYHPPSGLWFVRNSSTGTDTASGFGGTGYAPVRGDFDGDGKNDLAVFHDASGLWFIKRSSTGAVVTTGFGSTGYVLVPENYDGDGQTDLAVYHPPSGLWYMRSSLAGGTTTAIGFGGSGYNPVN